VQILHTLSDNIAEDGRVAESETNVPSFSGFCAKLLPHKEASKIGYLPLIPASPMNPAVLTETTMRIVKISDALGNKWTVITGD